MSKDTIFALIFFVLIPGGFVLLIHIWNVMAKNDKPDDLSYLDENATVVYAHLETTGSSKNKSCSYKVLFSDGYKYYSGNVTKEIGLTRVTYTITPEQQQAAIKAAIVAHDKLVKYKPKRELEILEWEQKQEAKKQKKLEKRASFKSAFSKAPKEELEVPQDKQSNVPPSRYCWKCGKPVPDGSVYCLSCGAKLPD